LVMAALWRWIVWPMSVGKCENLESAQSSEWANFLWLVTGTQLLLGWTLYLCPMSGCDHQPQLRNQSESIPTIHNHSINHKNCSSDLWPHTPLSLFYIGIVKSERWTKHLKEPFAQVCKLYSWLHISLVYHSGLYIKIHLVPVWSCHCVLVTIIALQPTSTCNKSLSLIWRHPIPLTSSMTLSPN
jgi:hypothetical protein